VIRRRRAALLVALAAVAASGCSTFDDNDAAATVGEDEVSRDDYESMLAAVSDAPTLQFTVDAATGTVAGDNGRTLLTAMVEGAANDQYLASAGESITEEDRDAVLANVPEDDPVLDLPDEVVQLFVDLQAAPTARGRVATPDGAELERLYVGSPGSLGALCARHIQVATEGEALDVLGELEAGADFVEVAAERSTDPAAAESDAVLGAECIALSSVTQAGPDFLSAIEASEIGEPTQPVQTSLGWHVIERRPFDEIAEPLEALFAEQGTELMFDGYLATSDVGVDPRYGRWDPLTSSVVAL
jgi:PPIC-type PPIASE domain